MRAVPKISFQMNNNEKIFSDTKNIWHVNTSQNNYYIGLLILSHKFNIKREKGRKRREREGERKRKLQLQREGRS